MPRSASRRTLAVALLVAAALLGACGAGRSTTTKAATKTTKKVAAKTTRKVVTTRRPAVTTRPVATTRPVTTTRGAAAPTTTAARPARVPVPGFGELAIRLVQAGMAPEKAETLCALLAETAAQHSQGLMGRRDLSGYDGMLFTWAQDVQLAFWMRTVPVGLSIAWFASDGALVGTADMAPCGDRDDCPVYGAPKPYRYAIEVLEGGLPALGVTPGVRLELLGTCPA